MREITPGIIDFANIGAFIDAPLKTYSSGMRARVGFAIATAVDPDILLLDEVLQTGDNTFKEKSRKRIAEVLQTAKAVVMVTHDMSWITAFCNRAILLDKGEIVADGDPEEIADLHEQDAEKRAKQKRKAKQLLKHGKVDLVDIRQARKEGTMDELVAGREEEMQELLAEKKRKREKARAKRRAARAAREQAQAAAVVGAADGAHTTITGDQGGTHSTVVVGAEETLSADPPEASKPAPTPDAGPAAAPSRAAEPLEPIARAQEPGEVWAERTPPSA